MTIMNGGGGGGGHRIVTLSPSSWHTSLSPTSTTSTYDEESNSSSSSRLIRQLDEHFDKFNRSSSDTDVESSTRVPVVPWRSTVLLSLIFRLGIFLLPSFVSPRFSRTPSSSSPSPTSGRRMRPGPTAYLDGMRGLAALFVFFCHHSYTSFVVAQGYGYGESSNYHFLKLPIVRLWYQGPPMVCVFFVISGYALSLKPLRLSRSRNFEGFSATMSSFVFRRGLRLFLPTAISTLMVVVLLRLGAYEWTRDFANDPDYHRNVREIHYRRFDTLGEQVWDWVGNMWRFVHIWDWAKFGGSTGYDPHLWTIPVEFRASMMLFLVLLGTARLRTAWRVVTVLGALGFVYRSDRWEMVLFLAGMILAELDLMRSNSERKQALPIQEETEKEERGGLGWKGVWWVVIGVMGLYLMSQPDEFGEETPGWVTLSSVIPEWWSDKYRYWQSWGAILFVLAVGRLPGWQRVFNGGSVQYLGKISYSLYLVHGPVLHTVGYATERWVWTNITGIETEPAYNAGFALAAVVIVPMVIWAADVFWRAVDAPVVRFAKWVEGRCSI
ncbi:acyltransferase family-domain-containing protein [Diplogelasinospora grovesii]|uniref:Acyltransferase family-domain-containing protein n=1 Tax=Diplogelasinospora grovesii TaxID=303347 RepID=A0AAN6NHL2_9PEZI|nr:acyltransferase family-domain-containing protein [Diplogelasinospora grovesii]